MASGLTIKVVDPDDDYLGIEIYAWNDRFAGSTKVAGGRAGLRFFSLSIAPNALREIQRAHTGEAVLPACGWPS